MNKKVMDRRFYLYLKIWNVKFITLRINCVCGTVNTSLFTNVELYCSKQWEKQSFLIQGLAQVFTPVTQLLKLSDYMESIGEHQCFPHYSQPVFTGAFEHLLLLGLDFSRLHTTLTVYLELSKVNLCQSLEDTNRFSSRIAMQLAPSILPSTLTSCWV